MTPITHRNREIERLERELAESREEVKALDLELARVRGIARTALYELQAFIEFTNDCPHCEGEGIVVIGYDEWLDENEEGDCPHCKGTGKYQRPISLSDPLPTLAPKEEG